MRSQEQPRENEGVRGQSFGVWGAYAPKETEAVAQAWRPTVGDPVASWGNGIPRINDPSEEVGCRGERMAKDYQKRTVRAVSPVGVLMMITIMLLVPRGFMCVGSWSGGTPRNNNNNAASEAYVCVLRVRLLLCVCVPGPLPALWCVVLRASPLR